MYILIHNTKDRFAIQLSPVFSELNIESFYSSKDEADYLYKSNQEEYYLNSISESLNNPSFKGAKAIIIDKNLGGSDWSRAIGLASHIACMEYSQSDLNKIPIVLTDWYDLDIEDPSLKNTTVNNLFQTQGFYFRKYENVFPVRLNNISGQRQAAIEFEIKKLAPVEVNKITVNHANNDRHQSTNEWGAMRLASNFGIFDKIKFTYPKHLYFKYLSRFIKKEHGSQDISLNNLFTRILLIDDNADCGWVELLENIHKCQVDKRVSSTEIRAWQNITPEKFDRYDLIYLDLYLEKGKTDTTSSISTLKFIKKNFPHIPVIIFTASEKAWNLDEVLEKGADGMYIKESPLYYRNDEYSVQNFNDFKFVIKYVHAKYKILSPYWKAIQEILTDNVFLNIHEIGNSKFKERIKERLEMFFGLLKRGLEQTEYNELRFHFSDYELAFVTLWSILNEISEANFEKTQPSVAIIDSAGAQISMHPGGNSISYNANHYKWRINGQTDIFVEYSYNLTLDSVGNYLTNTSGRYFKLTHEQKSCFEFSNNLFQIVPSIKTKTNYETTLFLQIAFLLERKNNLSTSVNKTQFQTELIRLNDIRNHLYLTHGSDISTGFYNQTEKNKRAAHNIKPDQDIKALFELISFLLTGKENIVNI